MKLRANGLDSFMSGTDNMVKCKNGNYAVSIEACDSYDDDSYGRYPIDYAYDVDRYGDPIPIFDGPHSQNDCEYGMVFRPSPTAAPCGGVGQSKCPAGRCVEPVSQSDCPSGFKFIKHTCPPMAPCQRRNNKCVKSDDFGYGDNTPTPKEAPPTPPTSVTPAKNWLLPALLIGAGVFILTRKSAE